MSKYYIIYTKGLAYELRKRGFHIVSVGVNKNYPQYDTYTFANSQELQDAIQDILQKKRERKTIAE